MSKRLETAAEHIRDIATAARHSAAKAIVPVLLKQARQAASEILSGGRSLDKFRAAWERQLMEAKHGHAMLYAVDGYRLGEAALGKRAAMDELYGKAIMETADDLLSRRIGQNVRQYVETTSKLETETTIDKLASIFQQGIAENKTSSEIAADFLAEGASWVEGQGRAELMARTMSQWAYNTGSMTAYKDAGYRSVWSASSDACEGCAAKDGVVADETGAFDGEEYPLHPHDRCTVIPQLEE